MDFEAIKAELLSHGTQEGLKASWIARQPDIRMLSDDDKIRITGVKDVWKAWLSTPDDGWTDRWYRGEE